MPVENIKSITSSLQITNEIQSKKKITAVEKISIKVINNMLFDILEKYNLYNNTKYFSYFVKYIEQRYTKNITHTVYNDYTVHILLRNVVTKIVSKLFTIKKFQNTFNKFDNIVKKYDGKLDKYNNMISEFLIFISLIIILSHLLKIVKLESLNILLEFDYVKIMVEYIIEKLLFSTNISVLNISKPDILLQNYYTITYFATFAYNFFFTIFNTKSESNNEKKIIELAKNIVDTRVASKKQSQSLVNVNLK